MSNDYIAEVASLNSISALIGAYQNIYIKRPDINTSEKEDVINLFIYRLIKEAVYVVEQGHNTDSLSAWEMIKSVYDEEFKPQSKEPFINESEDKKLDDAIAWAEGHEPKDNFDELINDIENTEAYKLGVIRKATEEELKENV